MSKSHAARALLFLLVLLLAGFGVARFGTGVTLAATPSLVLLPTVVVAPNGQTTIALAYEHGEGTLLSADLRITWDPALATLVSAQKGALVSSWTLVQNSSTPGLLRAALATGDAGISSDGALLTLTFQALNPSGVTALTITQASLNEGEIATTIEHGSLRINRPPVAGDDSFETDEDTQLSVVLPGVRAGDSDPENDALAFALASPPAHGIVDLLADGSFTYMPAQDFSGGDTFDYRVSDPYGGTDTGRVSITVQPVNDAPSLIAGGPFSVNEGASRLLSITVQDVDHASGHVVEWDLDNNGSFETTGATPTFSAALLDGPSSVTTKVRARDPGNAQSPALEVAVPVLNVTPSANAGGPYVVSAGGTLQLDGTASSDPAASADPLTYAWDLDDDGVYESAGAMPMFDATMLADTVVTIHLKVSDDDGATSASVSTTVTVGAAARYTLNGAVRYWNGLPPVPNVEFVVTGGSIPSIASALNGTWSLTNLLGGAYTVTPTHDADSEAITAYDAALVLQHVTTPTTLSGHGAVAANINQENGISALDASLILQHAVGLIGVPVIEDGKVWLFDPAERLFNLPGSQQSDQDFVAILLGDPSGNWLGTDALAASSSGVSITLSTSASDKNGLYTVTLAASEGRQLYSVQATLRYLTHDVSIVEVRSAVNGALLAYADDEDGEIRVALARGEAIESEVPLLQILVETENVEALTPVVVEALVDEVKAAVVAQHSVFMPIVSY